ncbi:Lrp/AsnC family transcriptional regulator [Novosphingobium profundi]|uniref:Lrp/AsnC family transcriptional regulator n=1 Tax=Novosphingobium profundi TaxID=1774954 RepID=UPI001FE518F2|nr:Lrp/AsnC family transcriptional regulator [Novosphingobium profundi]
MDIERTDYRILNELSLDGRMPDVTLGERVHLSSTAVARRRKILEEKGIIRGYEADLDLGKLELAMTVVVMIELASQAEHVLNEFEQAVVACPSLSYCSFISGETDFLMILHVRSFEDYDRAYRRELSTLPHVARIRSSFVMRNVLDHRLPPALFEPMTNPARKSRR